MLIANRRNLRRRQVNPSPRHPAELLWRDELVFVLRIGRNVVTFLIGDENRTRSPDNLIAIERAFAIRLIIENARYVFTGIAAVADKAFNDFRFVVDVEAFKTIYPIVEDILNIALKFLFSFKSFQ